MSVTKMRAPRGLVHRCLAVLAAFHLFAAMSAAQDVRIGAKRPSPPIQGSLVIVGGGEFPQAARQEFVIRGGGPQGKLVVIPTASVDGGAAADVESHKQGWPEFPAENITVLHAADPATVTDEFCEPLTQATAVWLDGGDQRRLTASYLNTPLVEALRGVLARNGVVGGTSAGAAVMSQVMIAQGNPKPEIQPGFGLLRDCIIDQHFLRRNRFQRLQTALAGSPGLFGLGIDEGTALVVDGRQALVVGSSFVTLVQSPGGGRPLKVDTVSAGSVLDLTTHSRAALGRAELPFPPASPERPTLTQGTLVIGGGGGLSTQVLQTFIEACGGADALIVVVPNALDDVVPTDPYEAKMLQQAGARNVQVWFAKDPEQADDAAFCAPLDAAGGIWFTGGRQWRLVDAYLDTVAHQKFHAVLERGGAIGGSSAGASIQAEYMVRGNPLGNLEIMVEGYDRGLAFLTGTAVDQHFTQRGRLVDMVSLKQAYPQLLGIGIDESTALIVRNNTVEVVGEHAARFFPMAEAAAPELAHATEPAHVVVPAGRAFDLVTQTLLDPPKEDTQPTTPAEPEPAPEPANE